jgi:RNA polymerase sigma-70 factor, ECF subfamily
MELQITTLMEDGDHREALRLMAEQYSGPVKRFCASMVGNLSEAEELMQETYIDAWKAMPGFRAESNVRSWFFGIARRVCIRHLRKRDRRAGLLQRWFGSEPGSATSDEPAVDLDERALLRRGLAELKPELRQAVLLRYQVGMEGAEMALALGVKPAAARKRVSLGIGALRDSLRPLLMEPPSSTSSQEEDDEPEQQQETKESVSAASGPRIVRP